ncbi:type I polyketide synthase [Streptomyces sp. TRM49041]|uniref:type I polyketide synthase n=1 Tax=Streptomyces sp. TRM49041 TaxID=2603216 RepID=UPI0011EDBD6F|nr:type I polyketide synthase [Streptomyces sp. TRM49041]
MSDFDDRTDDSAFIAVIGMAGRFPGAPDTDAFWSNLTEGRDTVTRGTPQLFPGGAPDGSDQTHVPARGLLDRPEWFDAGYFAYSAREALLIDPQHRVFLECAVEALENAGQDPDRFPGAVGVYGGSTETPYARTLLAQRPWLGDLTEDDVLLATSPDFLASRTAERLGLHGPAVAVQSACATALVAVHTAARALLSGDCDMALAGGVAVHVPPKKITWTGADGTLAPDGTCRPFDARGEGTVASNGVGVVVLKRLADARSDGDHIRAVLRGSAVTNDGAARIGFTAPSVRGQAAAVREAQLAAGTDARTITYVETHGTATPLGDPIEIAALTEAFREDTDNRGFCAIGSVKSNIGHADAAAGAAGLIKTVLALEHGEIPPSLHHTEPNPRIDFESGPFRVATRLRDWRPEGTPRRAGVSSFAVGGVNAHLVLEEAPARRAQDSDRSAQLYIHSARTESALRARVRRLAEHLVRDPALAPADVAWTLQTGRREHAYRAFQVVGPDGTPAEEGAAQPVLSGVAPARERPVVFLFPGQVGPAGAWRLHSTEPAFQEAFQACTAALEPRTAKSVKDVARGLASPNDPVVHDTYVFALEYSLAALWRRWGIRPAAVLGTGAGTLAAAAVAGAYTVPDALRLVAERARAGADAERAAPVEQLDGTTPQPLQVPVVLPDDGTWHDTGTVLGAARWWRALRGRPPADAALGTVLAGPDRILLEVGAGTSLTSLARRQPAHTGRHLLLGTLPDLEEDGADVLPALYSALGRLWTAGTAVSWEGVHDGEHRAKVPLPAYPFERLPFLLRHPDEADDETARAMGSRTATATAPDPRPLGGATPAATAGHGEVTGTETAGGEPPTSGGPAADDTSRPDAGPADDTPLALVLRLFGDALGLPDIEPDESFFELGGDSLIAARLLAQIRETYPVEIRMRSLFSSATAADLAALIERQLADPDRGTGTDEEPS